jgi:pimeloyl-ACP methyl ester carboxylesterase
MDDDAAPSSRERQPLVLIPGLLNDGDLWRDQIAALGDVAACQVADISQGETLEALAESVLATAPPRFSLAGFSMGGYVAQEIMRRAPDRVTRLALLDTSLRADTPERLAARRALDKTAVLPGKFHGFGDRLLGAYLAPSHLKDEVIIGRIRAMTARLGAQTFLRQNGIERKDGVAVLHALSCPLLILCGEHDSLTPVADHRAMAALAAHARLVIVPDSGHMTPLENPEAVTQALRSWLEMPVAQS